MITQEEILKKYLPSKPYFLEQTGIAEIAPRPTLLTYEILKSLYSDNGPIKNVYKSYGVSYKEKDFLKVIGNQLYVDHEQELHTLLPAYTYFAVQPFKIKAVGLKGFWRSFKNTLLLQLINNKIDKKLQNNIVLGLKKAFDEEADVLEIIANFFSDYELIFRVNLLADKSLKSLDSVLKNFEKKSIDILSSQQTFGFGEKNDLHLDVDSWRGNSLNLTDMSKFENLFSGINGNNLDKWWHGLTNGQRNFLIKPIKISIYYNNLREFGRWLVVKYINDIRNALEILGPKFGIEDVSLMYFVSLQELNEKSFRSSVLSQRKQEYYEFNNQNFPSVLRSDQANSQFVKYIGLSPGKVTGKLVNKDGLSNDNGNQILYTYLLTPDLVQYFNQIKGIVSEKGSALSHLAIMAREKGLPVVSGIDLSRTVVKIGDEVELNGSDGTFNLL